MNQIIQDKMKREILVISNKNLFSSIERSSKVYSQEECDFEKNILENYEYMVREIAEENREYKQPIPYAIVLNEKNEIFVYKRGGSGSNAGEKRLHEKIAIGVGGHIEREDENSKNLLKDALVREVEEELNISPDAITEAFPIGYINSDEDNVSEVHFGIGYVVKVNTSEFELLDGELEHGSFMNYTDFNTMMNSGDYDVETWSKMLAPYVEKYI